MQSGSVRDNEEEEADGGVVAVVDLPDPRWPHLHRWSQGSPSMKPRPLGTSPRTEPPSTKSQRSTSKDPVTSARQSSPADSAATVAPPQAIQEVLLSEKGFSQTTPVSPSSSLTGTEATTNQALVPKSVLKAPATAFPLGSPTVTHQILGESSANTGAKVIDELRPPTPHGSASPTVPAGKIAPGPIPLKGAWAKKLRISNPTDSQIPGKAIPSFPPKEKVPPEASCEDNVRFPWETELQR